MAAALKACATQGDTEGAISPELVVVYVLEAWFL
jgi:hypothetical protein